MRTKKSCNKQPSQGWRGQNYTQQLFWYAWYQFCTDRAKIRKLSNHSIYLDKALQKMTEDQVKQIVIDIINEIAPDEDTSDLKGAINLREQMNLDSMDFLDIVMELRKQHGIEVPEADYPELASLDSCANYLTPKFNAK